MKNMKWAIKITAKNLESVLRYRDFGEIVEDRTTQWIGKYMTEGKFLSVQKPKKYLIVTEILNGQY